MESKGNVQAFWPEVDFRLTPPTRGASAESKNIFFEERNRQKLFIFHETSIFEVLCEWLLPHLVHMELVFASIFEKSHRLHGKSNRNPPGKFVAFGRRKILNYWKPTVARLLTKELGCSLKS